MKKRICRSLVLGGCLSLISVLFIFKTLKAGTIFYRNIANEVALSFSKNYVVDMSSTGADRISAQVTFSTATVAAGVFTDGAQSTFTVSVASYPFLVESRSSATITVSSNSMLNGNYAQNSLSIASNSIMDGDIAKFIFFVSSTVNASSAIITVNGLSFGASVQFNLGTSATGTAINLAGALNVAFSNIVATTGSVVTAGGSIGGSSITLTTVKIGSAYNAYQVSTSSQAAFGITNSSFVGGTDPVTLILWDTVEFTSYTLTSNVDFAVGASSQITAFNLSRAVTNKLDDIVFGSTSGVQSSSVAVILETVGAFANGFILTSSSQSALQVGTPNFTGGADRVSVVINGVVFVSSVNFFTDITASGTATNLSSAIINTARLAASTINFVNNPYGYAPVLISSAQTSVVNLAAISTGSAYTYALATSSQSALSLSYKSFAISGATVSAVQGGRDVSYLIVNGILLRQGVNWFAAFSNTDTAKSISNAISITTPLAQTILSTWTVQGSTGVVYSTSIANGSTWNFAIFTSSQPALLLSGNVVFNSTSGVWASTATGGSNPSYSTATSIISLPNNTLGVGTAVLYSTGGTAGGSFLNPLVFATTYFIIKTDSSNVQLALTSTGAVAGSSITLTSLSTQAVTHTFTLTPIPPLGTSFGWWQVSNDGLTWFNVNATTISLASPYISTSTYNDFGQVNERYRRFTTMMSTSGAYTLTISAHGKY